MLGKSKASVSKYYAELEAIYPALIRRNGREKILVCDRSMAPAVLEEFEPYLSTPVIRQITVTLPESLDEYKEIGCRVAGTSALALKSDLAFSEETIILAMPKLKFDEWASKLNNVGSHPRYGSPSLVIEQWAYWDDFSDSQIKGPSGLECVSDFSLFASLSSYSGDDVRFYDAVKQVKKRICR